ncbi:hypothetical protein MKW92_004129 [Papaver armeniacum]|nr:hypothetical protein MKW92_004129 [Papaver armeniacum]
MAKNTLIFSPLFFGLIFLILIAFISEGGVSCQSCLPGGSNIFAGKLGYTCSGCDYNYCNNLAVPAGYTKPNSGVKSFYCSNVAPRYVTPYLCLCCVD